MGVGNAITTVPVGMWCLEAQAQDTMQQQYRVSTWSVALSETVDILVQVDELVFGRFTYRLDQSHTE